MLNERNWGKWENVFSEKERQTFKKLREQYEKLTREERFQVKLADDMESDEEALIRYKRFITRIAKEYAGKKILLVSHGNILKILLVHLGFGNWQELPSGSITNTGYVVFYTNGEDFIIKETHGIIKNLRN